MRRKTILISTAVIIVILMLCGSVWAAAGNVLFEDDFNDGDANGWEEYDGLFSVVSGVYQVESTGRYNDARSVAGDLSWTDYVIELNFNNQTTDRAACVLFRVQEVASGMDAGRYYQLHIRSNKVGFAEIDYSGGYATLLAEVPYTVSSQTWHHLQISINGTRAIALIDGKYVLSYDDFGKYTWGKMGLKIINGGVVLYDNVTISDANGPIAHWTFDEGSGTIAYDSAGINDGTISGAVWSTGQVGGALDFDGVDDYVAVPDNPTLSPDQITITAWIYPEDISHNFQIVGKWGMHNPPSDYIFDNKNNNDGLRFGSSLNLSGYDFVPIYSEDAVLNTNMWQHVAVTWDGSKCTFYVNSENVGEDSNYSGNLPDSDNPVYIGRNYNWGTGGPRPLDGKMDDVRIYDRALSAAEIMELYTPVDTGPIAHWKFDEGGGTIAYDSAGTNDGTIYGAAWTTGQIGSALDFDGVNDYVQIPDDPSLDITDELTINAWVKYNKQTETGPRDIVWSARRWRYSLRRHDDIYQFIIYDTTTGWKKAETKDITFDKDTWYHLVGTYRNGDKVKIYVNGTLNNEISISTITLNPQTEYIRIGVAQGLGSGGEWFNGTIDDVRIYDRSLSAEEIWDIYAWFPTKSLSIDIKPGSCPNPLNVKSRGLLPVAILGSEDFDVNTIVATSVRLAGVAPIRDSYEDVGTPLVDANDCECSTEGPDGFGDLTLKFETQEIVEAIGEVNHGDELVLELAGVLLDETPIEGSDCIIIRGRHKPVNRADFNGDGIVDMADFAAFAENWLQSSIVEY
jgi:hypothetical protein